MVSFVKKGDHLDLILEKKFWDNLWSWRGYSRDCFKPNFRSPGLLVSMLWAFDWHHDGCRSAFLDLCQKWRAFRPQIWKKNSGNIFDHKEDFRSLGPLVSILRAFEWRNAMFWSAFLGPLSKKGPFRPKIWKKNSGNIFDHKEDTLRIILSPISGL